MPDSPRNVDDNRFELDSKVTPAPESLGANSTRKLRVGDHACDFYQDERLQWTVALPILKHGLLDHDKCLIVTDADGRWQLERLLQLHAIPGTRRRQGQLVITTPDLIYFRNGVFSPEEILVRWSQLVHAATAEGYKSLVVVTDMASVLRHAEASSRLPEYEARVNDHLSQMPFSSLCQYDQRICSDNLLMDILQTHPIVFTKGEPHENPYYLPRNLFRSQNSRDKFDLFLYRLSQSNFEPTVNASRSIDSSRWQIYCLGELRVVREGVTVAWDTAHGATRRVKALFAYLLEHGKDGASKEKLVDLLWPDQNDLDRCLSRLYHTIHALRTALEPDLATGDASRYVLSHEDGYQLALPPETWSDVETFEDLCRRGERAYKIGQDDDALRSYLAAENLYAGDLFSDIPGSCAERLDDDWCWSRRYWLRDMYLKLMLHLAEIYLRRDSVAEALHYWQRALKLDPCCEDAHRGMMRAFHRAGRPDALARQYRICERQLRRQENRLPDSQTLTLWQSLVAKKTKI